jgi:N-methylhydantoinase A/oxoprolinase/acetone carboxylase beta subunit
MLSIGFPRKKRINTGLSCGGEKLMGLKLGIDVGGTHTDAVILSDNNELLAAAKAQTTADVTSGIIAALDLVLKKSGVDTSEIKIATLGTTHCINAVVERKRLARVAAIRLSSPAGLGIPPFSDWPKDLVQALGGLFYIVEGGYEYDGREFSRLNEDRLRDVVRDALAKGAKAFAVTGMFSPVRPDQELRAASIIKEVAGDEVPISLSHQIGSIGLIERENATMLNAALVDVARAAATAFRKACEDRGIHAKIYFSQNDGTLMSLEYAMRYPIFTISSGPTNSIRGAGFLTGLTDCIVVDIGGTTMLVGALVRGFPRRSALNVDVGGVRTNFRMPDLLSIGCGGGSIVKVRSDSVIIGPESVGYELITKGMAWGGNVLTTTDIALAAGYAKIEDAKCDPSALRTLSKEVVAKAVERIVRTFEDGIDSVKLTPEPVDVVLVGGGGIIIPPDYYTKLKGVRRVIRPPEFQYANAIGAAIAQVGGEIDRIYPLEGATRDEVLKSAKEAAIAEAIRAGAKADTVQIVDLDEIPLAYLPSNAVRIRVKAVGSLSG